MAIRDILDLPETLRDERNEYQRLFNLGTSKSTTGQIVFNSISSGKAYSTVGTIYSNQGEVGMQALLFLGDVSTPLNPKLVDYSFYSNDITDIKNEIGTNIVRTTATQTLTNKTLTTPKVYQFLNSATGLISAVFDAVFTSVNYLYFLNSVAGVAPQVRAEGTDTNINLIADGKGTGRLVDRLGQAYAKLTGDTFTGRVTETKPSVSNLGDTNNIVYRDLAQASQYTSAQRTVVIELPAFYNAFYTIRILGYDYNGTLDNGNTWELLVASQFSDPFNTASAVLIGKAPFSSVRLGKNGAGKPVILLGTLTTTWDYSHIAVMEAMGRNVGSPDGWSITFASTESGITIQKTPVLQGDKRTAQLSASYTYTATALADIPAFAHKVVAGTYYDVDIQLRCLGSGGADTGNIALALADGAVGVFSGTELRTGATPELYNTDVLSPIGIATFGNGTYQVRQIKGIFQCTTSGTLKLQVGGNSALVTKQITVSGTKFAIQSI